MWPLKRTVKLPFLLAFLMVVLLATVCLLYCSKDKPAQEESLVDLSGMSVPPIKTFGGLNVKIKIVGDTFPMLDRERPVHVPFNIISKLRDSRFLQTTVDRAIQGLLDEYITKNVAVSVVWKRPKGFDAAGAAYMAYDCVLDRFELNPDADLPPDMWALLFYHELAHAVECKRKMQELGFTDHVQMKLYMIDQASKGASVHETSVGYAAQVRFFLALYHGNKLGKFLARKSQEEPVKKLLTQTANVWRAIEEGYFSRWYDTARVQQ